MDEISQGRPSPKLAHDLYNTLAVIKLYAQIGLRNPGLKEDLREGFNIIVEQVARAKEMCERFQEQDWLRNGDEGSISSNIADKKPAEDGLLENPYRLLVLFQNLPGMAYRCLNTPGWPMEFVSDGCLSLTGYPRERFTGPDKMQFEEIIHPEDRKVVNEKIKACVQLDQPFILEYRIITKQGIEKQVWEKGQRITGPNKEEWLEGFVMDVSGQKKAQDELHETQEKLLSIFRVAPSGIGMVRDRVIVEVNQRICEMTGYLPEELIGQSARILYPSQQDFDFVGTEKYNQIRKKGIGIVETRWKCKNGSIIDIMLASTPLFPGDNTRGVIFTALDITERKKSEEEHRQLQQQLIQSQKLETIGRLAGGVAHEFNNTLQIINSYAELSLMKLEPGHPTYAYIQQILNSTRQSSGIISQLLAFARKQAVSPEVLDLNEVVGSMIIMLQQLIGDRVELAWKPGTGIWPVQIDPIQVNQVLVNLAINARDAISGNGMITIETKNETCADPSSIDHEEHTPGDFVLLTVTDNGCGMDIKTLNNIFEPFFTTKDKYKGTGLGLATVYGIVKQNSGFISVTSEPGKGSAFRLYFPRFRQ